jgi:hypothetical protein
MVETSRWAAPFDDVMGKVPGWPVDHKHVAKERDLD